MFVTDVMLMFSSSNHFVSSGFFVWNGCAGARADGRCFHHLSRARQTSDLTVLISDFVCDLQFRLWMDRLFYLAALRLIWGIMADLNVPNSD